MKNWAKLDDRGIPVLGASEKYAIGAPPKPCTLCTGKASSGQPSWEWCQEMKTCAATVDWERIYADKA